MNDTAFDIPNRVPARSVWFLIAFVLTWQLLWWLFLRYTRRPMEDDAAALSGFRVRIEQPPPAVVEQEKLDHEGPP